MPPATCCTPWPPSRTARSWTPLLKPWPLKPAVEGGFTIDDFTYDPDAGTADLPRRRHPRRSRRKGNVIFGIACRGCPLRAAVHHLRDGPHDPASANTTSSNAHTANEPPTKASRPPTASTGRWSNARIAWLTRGNRRVPYRGIEKNNNWLHHRVAALNLRRLLAMGLTIDNGTWALA